MHPRYLDLFFWYLLGKKLGYKCPLLAQQKKQSHNSGTGSNRYTLEVA